MLSKEKVKRAVEMREPDSTPLCFFNKYLEKSDILFTEYSVAEDFKPDIQGRTEWGFVWKTHDNTMGQPYLLPLESSWESFESYKLPDPNAAGRFNSASCFVKNNNDKYIIGNLGITGFNLVTFLRGFENVMEDLYTEPELLSALINKVFYYEKEIIKNFASAGVDAVSFFDDWGTQNGLMINPTMWREIFKPRYKEQFELAHSLDLHVFFHCCGQIYDIIGDLIEIGADMLNLNQPDLLGIEKLNKEFGGKTCFVCPVDHQTVAINGNREDIFNYVKKLSNNLGCHSGGYIGLIEEYSSVGMSNENFINIVEAFEKLRNGN